MPLSLPDVLLWCAFAVGFLAIATRLLVLAIRHRGWARGVALAMLAVVTFVLGSASAACGSQVFGGYDDLDVCAPRMSFVVAPLWIAWSVLGYVGSARPSS